MLARHVLDLASTSELLGEVATLAEKIVQGRSGFAPVGSARRQARDHGGRVASALDAWAAGFGHVAAEEGLPLHDRQRSLWGRAHPGAAAALQALPVLAREACTADEALDALAALDVARRNGGHNGVE